MSLFDSSSKGVKFDTVGATITGTVKSAPRERQQTKFGTQEPDFYPNGDPKMQILVDLQTELREDANDDGERTLYVASKNMKRAIGQAIRDAGASDVQPGGVLTVTYVGNDPASKNPANPAKMYAAQYTAPSSAFAATPPAQPAVAAPVPQQVPSSPVPQAAPAAQPVPVPAGAVTGHGLNDQQVSQLQQLRSAGIPEATIVTAIGATPQQLAAFDATPF